MISTLKVFLAGMLFCFFMDMMWLAVIAKKLYDNQIGSLLRKSGGTLAPNWPAAILVYIAIVGGIMYFVLPKAHSNYISVLIAGAIFGLVVYGVYDFTNYAILSGWTLKIALIDIVWGTTLCSLTATFCYFVKQHV